MRANLRLIDDSLRLNPDRQPPVPAPADRCSRSGRCVAQHERGRRARPLHPRVRARRLDDAVQHVSPLHGRRAPDPHHRLPVRYRARHATPPSTRSRPRSSAPSTIAARCTSRHSCTTSPRAATRITRKSAPASRASLGRASASRPSETETATWLVEHHLAMSTVRPEPRPERPQDHPRLRRSGAEPRAAEASARC